MSAIRWWSMTCSQSWMTNGPLSPCFVGLGHDIICSALYCMIKIWTYRFSVEVNVPRDTKDRRSHYGHFKMITAISCWKGRGCGDKMAWTGTCQTVGMHQTSKELTKSMADFSRAAACAHSMLRCTALPHGPLRMAYLLFGSPWASCSHLMFSHSSQSALIPFVHLPPRFHLII